MCLKYGRNFTIQSRYFNFLYLHLTSEPLVVSVELLKCFSSKSYCMAKKLSLKSVVKFTQIAFVIALNKVYFTVSVFEVIEVKVVVIFLLELLFC